MLGLQFFELVHDPLQAELYIDQDLPFLLSGNLISHFGDLLLSQLDRLHNDFELLVHDNPSLQWICPGRVSFILRRPNRSTGSIRRHIRFP
jgi:hypothetical protein